MSKADVIEVEGVVVEKLPNAFFKVELENGHQILATISGKLRMNSVAFLETRLLLRCLHTILQKVESFGEINKYQLLYCKIIL